MLETSFWELVTNKLIIQWIIFEIYYMVPYYQSVLVFSFFSERRKQEKTRKLHQKWRI